MQNNPKGVGRPVSAAAPAPTTPDDATPEVLKRASSLVDRITEIGGPSGPEPTRFGDWEKNGRCIDF